MKADLHVHSRFSTRPSLWVLQKLGCPESFTAPRHLYQTAKERGMALVTITDHNTIAGALEIAHLPDAFVSEEVTTYFPEDGCKVHVLAYRITEKQHEEVQRVRENIFDLVALLNQERILHAMAHPLCSVNAPLTLDHLEKSLLLFKNFELNGARDDRLNQLLIGLLSSLTRKEMERLADKQEIEPPFPEPWSKNVVGGSDDHSSLNIARTHTEVKGARNLGDFLAGIADHRAHVSGRASTPETFAHNLYGIAYQFYRDRVELDRYVHREILLQFFERVLRGRQQPETGVLRRIYTFWNHRKLSKAKQDGTAHRLHQLFRVVSHDHIWHDPDLMAIVRNGNGHPAATEGKWFDFVNTVTNRILLQFGNRIFDHLAGGNVFDLFHCIGSACALYSLLAPYFVSYSLFTQDRRSAQEIARSFALGLGPPNRGGRTPHVVHFTDTFHEVNGVALTLRQQLQAALERGKNLTVVTCDPSEKAAPEGVRNFRPVGSYLLPEYPELKLCYPPFLEILRYCYEVGCTHVHSATPGPVGLAALAISLILKVPCSGTYHTALPQYARYLTGDGLIEELMWKYVIWYYGRMDFILVPSLSTGRELVERGIDPAKVRQYPRGIDVEAFHPAKRSRTLEYRLGLRGRFRLLYVGRVSKEKNLELLVRVFKRLVQSMPEVTLIVVGDGPYLAEMKEALEGTPAVFTGYVYGEDLAAIYAACDLFVFPSTTDTFGNVVLEAQASGLPVIVTDSGGPQENVLPDETGMVVPAGDEEALLAAIQKLASDRAALKAMGTRARRYVEGRSFGRCFEETWRLYQGEEAAVAS